MKLLGMMLKILSVSCLLSACTTVDVQGTKENLRIGPVPIVRVEFFCAGASRINQGMGRLEED